MPVRNEVSSGGLAPAERSAAWPCQLGAAGNWQVALGGHQVDLATFLAACAASLRGEGLPPEAPGQFLALRNEFLAAGLPALRSSAARSAWAQVGLSYRPEMSAQLYARLAATLRELLADPQVANAFFMHKPPGMRVRVETTGHARARLAEELHARLDGWRADGVVEQVTPGVYEAEAHLFGGPASMRSVHRLFTADSLAWLGYHALASTAPGQAGAAWAVSLALLRPLFAALRIQGWEDRDVWDRVRWQTFRRLPERLRSVDAFAETASLVRRVWAQPAALREQLGPDVAALVAEHTAGLDAEAEAWRAAYFETRHAYVGPREAAAYYVVFHWNRAGLPVVRQALLAEALARSDEGP